MIASSIVGAVLLSFISILTILVALGAPLGEFTLGGKYPGVLPRPMRIMSAASVLVQLAAIFNILSVAGILNFDIPILTSRVVCIVLAIYFLINTGMNLCSRSKKEKYLMTPLSLVISVCFFVTFFMK